MDGNFPGQYTRRCINYLPLMGMARSKLIRSPFNYSDKNPSQPELNEKRNVTPINV